MVFFGIFRGVLDCWVIIFIFIMYLEVVRAIVLLVKVLDFEKENIIFLVFDIRVVIVVVGVVVYVVCIEGVIV